MLNYGPELVIEAATQVDGGASSGPRSRSVAEWRVYFNSRGWSVWGPSDKQFPVSEADLAEFSDDTQVSIYVQWIDPAKIGTLDPTARPS